MSALNITSEVNARFTRSVLQSVITNQQKLTVQTDADIVPLVRLITMKLHHCSILHCKHA
jgi:hypothetical protein